MAQHQLQRIRENDVLVEGLASSKRIAESLTGKIVYTERGVQGTIKAPFGTRGVVSVTFESPVDENEPAYYERFIEEEYRFGT